MFSLPETIELVKDTELFKTMLNYKRLEEERRSGSDLSEKNFIDFTIFEGMKADQKLKKAFDDMQNIYVFNKADELSFDFVIEQWGKIKTLLLSMK